MHSEVSKRINIQKEINLIPEHKLDEVKIYIEEILKQVDVNNPMPISLKGIWKESGFEKIIDLDSEILNMRKNFSNIILNKII